MSLAPKEGVPTTKMFGVTRSTLPEKHSPFRTSPTFLGYISHTDAAACSRLKKQKVEHGAYSTLKKLEAVKAMDRQEMEGTELTEAVTLRYSSSRGGLVAIET
jgi:hypothetical protein